jgi:hypothetical protein
VLLCPQHGSQPVDAGFVDPLRSNGGRQRLEDQPCVEQVGQAGAPVLEIDDDGAGGGTCVRLADQQSAARSAAHPGDLVVLHQADGLAQHRSAYAITLLQRVLRTQRFADGPAAADDVRLDAAGDRRSQCVRPAGLRLRAHQRLNYRAARASLNM